jgi:hypothetical protein
MSIRSNGFGGAKPIEITWQWSNGFREQSPLK